MNQNIEESEWVLLGEGNYNVAYKSADGKRVLKIQKNKSETDTPERSARLWNMINPHIPPPATIIESEHGLGWVCPYVEGEQANDEEISLGLLDIYNNSGRIILDATAPRNFLKTSEGKIVCIDIGMALQLDSPQQPMNKRMDDHSIISEDAWRKYGGAYNNFFKGQQFGNPLATNTVMALLFIKEHRPDIHDVSFLKNNRDAINQLADAFDEQNANNLTARKLHAQNLSPETIELAKQHKNIDKAMALLKAEKLPTLESVKESCIQELERYINSRGSIYEGKFNPSLMTKIFRDQQLTAHKVDGALKLIEKIQKASSSAQIKEAVESAYKADPQLLKKTIFSGLESSLAKCVAIAHVDIESANKLSLGGL